MIVSCKMYLDFDSGFLKQYMQVYRMASTPRILSIALAQMLLFIGFTAFSQAEGVSINSTGAAPDPSAILDLTSTDKGFLLPRMSEIQRDSIQNPAEGLMIYNLTTDCINMWDGAIWKASCFDCSFSNPVISSNSPICQGDSLMVQVGSVSNATYSWVGPNGFSSINQNFTIPNANPVNSGVYYLTIDVTGCPSRVIQYVISVSANPSKPVANSNSPVCLGGTLQLSTVGQSGVIYNWIGPNGFSSSNQNASKANFSNSDTGDYIVSVISGACQSKSDTVKIRTGIAPGTPGAISGDATPCKNSTNKVYSVSPVSNAISYTWTVPNGASIISGQGTNSITVNFDTVSGTVCVTANSACGSSSSNCLNIVLQNSGGASGSQTFNYTGSPQIFIVPGCINNVSFQVWGAQGGANNSTPGGKGGYTVGTLAVSGGDTLHVYVGGQGASNLLCDGTPGGFNGGGGVALTCCSPSGARGGSGGGASDIRYGGNSLNDRVIVGAGGGGASNSTPGAYGGGLVGANGITYNGQQTTGGTQNAGGNPGGNYSGCALATAGTFGQGGRGDGNDAGGGGGGWYGGVGGANNGPGGGGSSYYGGVTGGVSTANSRNGNGQIIISW